MKDSKGEIALVIGANRGIGRGIAIALAQNGFDVLINDLEETADTQVTLDAVQSAGRKARFVAADIGDTSAHRALVEAAFRTFGALHCLVNNAGVQVKMRGDILDVTEESFDRLMRINLRGTFFLTQAVARRMLAIAEPTVQRTIITLSSANAFAASVNRAEYCMSKTALSMMTKLFALRLADANIRCYEIRPGIIRTDMTRPAAERYDKLIAEGVSPIRRWGEAEDIGRTVAMLAGGGLPFSTGDAIHVDGGLHIQTL